MELGEGGSTEVWDGDRDMFLPDREEVGHFDRMEELRLGRRYRPGDTPQSGPSGEAIEVDWDGIRATANHRDGADAATAGRLQHAFDCTYCELLAILEDAFNGRPEHLDAAVRTMYRLKSCAQAVMEIPADGRTVLPTLAYVPPADRSRDPK